MGMQALQYNETETVGLMQLERRRVRSDLIETFKIMNGECDLNRDLIFQLEEGGRRGHDQKLFKRTFRLDIRKYAFCHAELLTTGTHYPPLALIVIPLTLLRSISRLNWNR